MGAYNLEEVIKRWERDELTAEQAIGQLFLLVQELSARVGKVEQRLELWRRGRGRPSEGGETE
jgi:hypothetical protein